MSRDLTHWDLAQSKRLGESRPSRSKALGASDILSLSPMSAAARSQSWQQASASVSIYGRGRVNHVPDVR